jgi:hypothetical protein
MNVATLTSEHLTAFSRIFQQTTFKQSNFLITPTMDIFGLRNFKEKHIESISQ